MKMWCDEGMNQYFNMARNNVKGGLKGYKSWQKEDCNETKIVTGRGGSKSNQHVKVQLNEKSQFIYLFIHFS